MRQFATALNIGAVRVKNQDQVSILHADDFHLMLVCDGMGGANAGEIASKICVESIQTDFENHKPSSADYNDLKKWAIDALNKANLTVLNKAYENPNYHGMGTTAVLTLFSSKSICVANVGDSRAYLFQNDKLNQISEDHSLVNQWIKEGKMTVEEAKRHPQRSVLTNVLGVMEKMIIDCFECDLNSEMILLCSDGLSGMLEDNQIEALIQQGGTVKQITKRLEKAALTLGGYDNIAIALCSEDQA